ncbi:hypothetical protein PPERSA_05123 [Pseudocohnilembus persalinus]|uniref:MEMO1 family n=1 Tax=Pseudocohnilembus persalinus TaxID=266149 RepID=A0A0V0QWB2_PSEPJ|nr:hypothetical protein PPERSA_05123 [Pseudocohnilembus persalinus]|eukprot:KRX06510.1 hypothetical protein PPERSA_05123 [Pseudocohnilembus persalinus]
MQQEFNIQKQENNNQNNQDKNSDEIDKQIQNYLQKIDMQARESTYAGYWYTKNASELSIQIQIWFEMAKCEIQNIKDIKAIISPHQGYAFSGPTAAWPFKYVKQYCQNKKNLKVFIFGSAHYCFLRSCSVSSLKKYKTPLGDIKLDTQIINELLENEIVNFEETDKDADEEEYSIEMQLPFLIKALGIDNFTLIPILETGNTICGKNSIGILLRLFLKTRQTEIETKFIKYNMDKIINDRNDNCISFAASVSFTE